MDTITLVHTFKEWKNSDISRSIIFDSWPKFYLQLIVYKASLSQKYVSTQFFHTAKMAQIEELMFQNVAY